MLYDFGKRRAQLQRNADKKSNKDNIYLLKDTIAFQVSQNSRNPSNAKSPEEASGLFNFLYTPYQLSSIPR